MRQVSLPPYLSVQSTCHSLSESFSQSASLSINLSVCFLDVYQSVSELFSFFVYLWDKSVCHAACVLERFSFRHPSVCPDICLSVSRSVSQPVCLSVCLSVSQNPSLSFDKFIFSQSVYFLLLLHLLYVTHPVRRSVSLSAFPFIKLSVC